MKEHIFNTLKTIINKYTCSIFILILLVPFGFKLVNAQQPSVVLETPSNLSPAYGNECKTAWKKFTNNRGHSFYLTLNVNKSSQSTNSGIWKPNLPYKGRWKVEAYISSHKLFRWPCPSPNNKRVGYDTTDARYTIHHATGNNKVSKNQRPINNQWLDLGTYTFNSGTSGYVQLTDINGERKFSRTISFGAMRFTYIDSVNPTATATSIPATPVPTNTPTATSIPATPVPTNTPVTPATPTNTPDAEAFSISGRILDGNNKPVADVIVTTDKGYHTKTDVDGYYRFSNLPRGTYNISPSILRKLYCQYTHQYVPASKIVIVTENVTGQDFVVKYATLSGQVKSNGKNLSQAEVRLTLTTDNSCSQFRRLSGQSELKQGPNNVLVTQTDSNGNYSFNKLPVSFNPLNQIVQAQSFRLKVTKSGHQRFESAIKLSGLATTKNVTLQPKSCAVPYFSQVDRRWRNHPLRTGAYGTCSSYCRTIGRCGCTLTSAAMLFSYYGADKGSLTPPELSNRMWRHACPFVWGTGARKSDGQASYAGTRWFSWSRLSNEINRNKRPVLVEMVRGKYTHWVLVLKGSGSNPRNYRIHDPGTLWGANTTLNNFRSRWRFRRIVAYSGRATCNRSVPSSNETDDRLIDEPRLQLQPSQSSNLTSSTTISAALVLYRLEDDDTVTVQLEAKSESGDIAEMLIWSDEVSNTTWIPYSTFATLPTSYNIFAIFRDEHGNESGTYHHALNEDTILVDETTLNYLPLIVR